MSTLRALEGYELSWTCLFGNPIMWYINNEIENNQGYEAY